MSEDASGDQGSGEEGPVCFIIMPISDPEGYGKGHFKRVSEDIVKPACSKAGFRALRADDVKETNLIQLDILQRLLSAEMAVCDLSSRNPNVLFELALRQAFDKPVALIQESGTPQIFDISPLRITDYRRERIYNEVLEDQKRVAEAILTTHRAHGEGSGINSIVKLLALGRGATVPEFSGEDVSAGFQSLILSELGELRDEVRGLRKGTRAGRVSLDALIQDELAAVRGLVAEAEGAARDCRNPAQFRTLHPNLRLCRDIWHKLVEKCLAGEPENDVWELLSDIDGRLDALEMMAGCACRGEGVKRSAIAGAEASVRHGAGGKTSQRERRPTDDQIKAG